MRINVKQIVEDNKDNLNTSVNIVMKYIGSDEVDVADFLGSNDSELLETLDGDYLYEDINWIKTVVEDIL